MRYSLAALLALASSVLAQVEGFDVMTQPGENEVIPAGETFEIVWTPDAKYTDKPVSIILIGGPSQPKQVVLETLATGIPSDAGSFKWEVDDSLGKDKVYGIKIMLEEDNDIFQYSFPFAITPDAGHGGDHSSAAPSSTPSSAPSSAPTTKTKTSTSKPSDYPTATPSASSSFSSVYVPSNISSIVPPSSTPAPTGTGTGAPSTTRTSTSTAVTGAATAFAANGLAVLGGFAMAVLAL